MRCVSARRANERKIANDPKMISGEKGRPVYADWLYIDDATASSSSIATTPTS
jgi:hypothetical protein